MIEAAEDPDEKISRGQGQEGGGEGDQSQRGAGADAADEHENPIFVAEGEPDDEKLQDERGQESEIGEEPDLGIAGDEETLGEQDGEKRRRDNTGRVGESVEQRGRKENLFFL